MPSRCNVKAENFILIWRGIATAKQKMRQCRENNATNLNNNNLMNAMHAAMPLFAMHMHAAMPLSGNAARVRQCRVRNAAKKKEQKEFF